MTLEKYFQIHAAKAAVHIVKIEFQPEKKTQFDIHPHGVDSQRWTFQLKGNNLIYLGQE